MSFWKISGWGWAKKKIGFSMGSGFDFVLFCFKPRYLLLLILHLWMCCSLLNLMAVGFQLPRLPDVCQPWCFFTVLCCCLPGFSVPCRDDLMDWSLLAHQAERFLSPQHWKCMACCSPPQHIDRTGFFRTPNSQKLGLVLALVSIWEPLWTCAA